MSVTLGGWGRPGVVLGLGQFALRGVTAVYSLSLVHLLRPQELGDFAFALAALWILVTVADGGFSRLLIRDVARSDGDHRDLIPQLLAVRTLWVGVTVVAAAVLFALVGGGVEDAAAVLALLLVALVAEATAGGFESAGVGVERPWRVAGGQLAASGAMIAVLTVLLVSGAGVAAAMTGPVAASLTKCVWHGLIWRHDLRWRASRAAPAGAARRWFREATPFLVLALLGAVYARIDVLLLHELRGARETASYAAAYRLVDAALVVGGVAAATVLPALSRLHRDAPGRVWPEWRRFVLATAAVSTPLVVLLVVFAEPVAGFLFGERYRATGGEDLRLLAPGIPFMLLQIVNASVLFTSDLQRLLVPMSLLHVGFNVVLTWLLADAHGSAGAAAATSISEVFTFAYFAAFVWWRFGRQADAA